MSPTQIARIGQAEHQYMIERDIAIRTEQAKDRPLADEALKASNCRLWVSGTTSTLPIRGVPGFLEAILGYPEQARLVGFFLREGECYYHDGLNTTTGELDAFFLFIRHWSIASRLQDFFFGSSSEEARHWLILNRSLRQISVVSAQLGKMMVTVQWETTAISAGRVADGDEPRRGARPPHSMGTPMKGDHVALEMQRQRLMIEMFAWLSTIEQG
jgi:hypothetical protein